MLDSRCRTPGLAAQQRANARRQLIQVERLDQVVIRAGIQALHAVGDGIARGDDENRQFLPMRAGRGEDLETSLARQAEIEQQQVESLRTQHLRSGLAVVHPVHGEALAPQALADRLTDHGVVFYQQQSHGEGNMIARCCSVSYTMPPLWAWR